jgi:hypothetical protein
VTLVELSFNLSERLPGVTVTFVVVPAGVVWLLKTVPLKSTDKRSVFDALNPRKIVVTEEPVADGDEVLPLQIEPLTPVIAVPGFISPVGAVQTAALAADATKVIPTAATTPCQNLGCIMTKPFAISLLVYWSPMGAAAHSPEPPIVVELLIMSQYIVGYTQRSGVPYILVIPYIVRYRLYRLV